MDNLTNLSVEWMRMPARNAASDSTDIVVYNPAALVRLGEGFHFNLGNQSLLRKPSHTYDFGLGAGERTFSQDGIDAFLPNFYAAYNKDKWAVYGGLYISGGGAVADYPHGSIATDLISLMVLAVPGAGRIRPAHRILLRRCLSRRQGPVPESILLLPDRHRGRRLRLIGRPVGFARLCATSAPSTRRRWA